ncbi:OmpH family outer membrane protein [bacterium]|nr:OmpH family outer membrane protein [bacterium]
MKNLKFTTLALMAGLMISFGNQAFAEVGYIDYQKVLENYPAAQQAIKEIDAKGLELQQYMVDKERQFKSLDTPLKKQNFEAQTMTEFNAKQEALYKLRNSKENQILTQVQNAAKAVMVAQHLDAVLSDQVIFVGGVDITDMVIQKLK